MANGKKPTGWGDGSSGAPLSAPATTPETLEDRIARLESDLAILEPHEVAALREILKRNGYNPDTGTF